MSDIIERIAEFNKFGSKLGLERMNSLLARLGDPGRDLKVIHVAGTNGKGSVCKYIYEVLQAAGYKTGLFISPYVVSFNERIQFDGRYITGEELEIYAGKAIEAAAAMTAAGEESPTEFEVVTAAALAFYAAVKPDFVILEVGMGGRGDSTNVFDEPLVDIITSISFDHMNVLGDTLEKIAFEKAGIIKKGVPVVINVADEGAKKVIAKVAYENGAPLTDLSDVEPFNISVSPEGTVFDVDIKGKQWRNVAISQFGTHQLANTVTALAAIEILSKKGIIKIDNYALAEGLKRAVQPARFEVFESGISADKKYVLDGAHNEDGMKSLAATVRSVFAGKKIMAIMGVLADKDVEKILDHATTFADKFLTLTVPNPRTMEGAELCERIKARGIAAFACDEITEALAESERALKEEGYDAVICCGSFYLISEIRRIILDGIFQR